MSFLVLGALTMALPFCRSFPLLVTVVMAMGLFDGCFISLLGPIAFELVGPAGASQAIGFLLTLCSVPLTAGPPVAGESLLTACSIPLTAGPPVAGESPLPWHSV